MKTKYYVDGREVKEEETAFYKFFNPMEGQYILLHLDEMKEKMPLNDFQRKGTYLTSLIAEKENNTLGFYADNWNIIFVAEKKERFSNIGIYRDTAKQFEELAQSMR